MSRIRKSIEIENRLVFARGRGEQGLPMGTGFFVGEGDENVLVMAAQPCE